MPDPSVPAQRVAFGTSGHRGSAFDKAFNEWHILAISQAICLYRKQQKIDGPLFLGMDTHALSVPALASALEVLAANGVEVMLAQGDEYTPTPADFPRDSDVQPRAQDRSWPTASSSRPRTIRHMTAGSNTIPQTAGRRKRTSRPGSRRRRMKFLEAGLQGVKRIPFEKALRASTTHRHDYLNCLYQRSRQCDRHGRHSRREAQLGRRSARRRRGPLLGADCRAVRVEPHGCQRGGRSDLPFHDGGLGRPDSHGPVLALCDAEVDRPEGSL